MVGGYSYTHGCIKSDCWHQTHETNFEGEGDDALHCFWGVTS